MLIWAGAQQARAAGPVVYVIDVHGTVWPGQAQFVIGKLDEAAKDGASAVILDIDSFGGLLQSADDVKKALVEHDRDYTEVAYVHQRALSSGSLIALSCKDIAMQPGGVLGSAQPHPGPDGGDPDAELLSYARQEFMSTAEYRGRNPQVAEAWVTSPTDMPSLSIKSGDILTLSVNTAQQQGYCDVVAPGISDILAYLHMSGAQTVYCHLPFVTAAALWISDPWVTVLFLALGLALVIIEMMTMHSWGLAGLIGGAAVIAVFAAHIIAGTATWVGLIVFIAGILFLLFETHVFPGHGLSAVAGLICVFLGIFWALGGTAGGALYPTVTAILVTLAIVIAFFIYLPRSRVWRVLSQNMQQKASGGYVAGADFTQFLGHRGTTLTLLRPSGAADVDGTRLTVVTEGAFLPPGAGIQVVKVQGSRVVVRGLEETEPLQSTPHSASSE
jgi:membrane-bound serine protease (ClpP class)